MTDQPETADATEAEIAGEKPDLGRTPDAMIEALSGSDSGSDTRAGSLEGGAATGSDDDPDSDLINETLASEGMVSAKSLPPASAEADPVNNTGIEPGETDEAAASPGEKADAATG